MHENEMKSVESVRYLGYIISSSGALRPCVENRRNKGWGKIAEIAGILSELPKMRRIEIGLTLREAKLHNGILFNSEAWSNVADSDMERLEQVDTAGLKDLVAGHSKCSKAFVYLEFGALMIRHIVMIRRLMYHHHIMNRDDCELIKKVYQKQAELPCKGDWVLLVRKDFNFIGENIDVNFILSTSKEDYQKFIKNRVQKAAFNSYIQLKDKSKTKMKDLKYDNLVIQNYLVSDQFSIEEKKLLLSLRSMCYPAKMNFRKMNKGNLKCSFFCEEEETQGHIFQACKPLLSRLETSSAVRIKDIYGTINEQRNAIKILIKIHDIRKNLLKDIPN